MNPYHLGFSVTFSPQGSFHLTGFHSIRYQTILQSPGRKKAMFYLIMHSTHFIYGYMALDYSVNESKPAAATSWATLSN